MGKQSADRSEFTCVVGILVNAGKYGTFVEKEENALNFNLYVVAKTKIKQTINIFMLFIAYIIYIIYCIYFSCTLYYIIYYMYIIWHIIIFMYIFMTLDNFREYSFLCTYSGMIQVASMKQTLNVGATFTFFMWCSPWSMTQFLYDAI